MWRLLAPILILLAFVYGEEEEEEDTVPIRRLLDTLLAQDSAGCTAKLFCLAAKEPQHEIHVSKSAKK